MLSSFLTLNAQSILLHAGRGLVIVRLPYFSGRALAAQARGVLGLTPGDCQPFHFPPFLPHNIYIPCVVCVVHTTLKQCLVIFKLKFVCRESLQL